MQALPPQIIGEAETPLSNPLPDAARRAHAESQRRKGGGLSGNTCLSSPGRCQKTVETLNSPRWGGGRTSHLPSQLGAGGEAGGPCLDHFRHWSVIC